MGVSVERINEAMTAMKYDIVSTVQIIFNLFRQRPAELLFSHAEVNHIGLIIRVPLASGLLSGKITPQTTFSKDDHRHFNREGKAFDKGETFSGVPLERAFPAIEELQKVLGDPLAAMALKWILMFDQVGTVIPGASSVEQVLENVKSAKFPDLTSTQLKDAERIYNDYIKSEVHHLW